MSLLSKHLSVDSNVHLALVEKLSNNPNLISKYLTHFAANGKARDIMLAETRGNVALASLESAIWKSLANYGVIAPKNLGLSGIDAKGTMILMSKNIIQRHFNLGEKVPHLEFAFAKLRAVHGNFATNEDAKKAIIETFGGNAEQFSKNTKLQAEILAVRGVPSVEPIQSYIEELHRGKKDLHRTIQTGDAGAIKKILDGQDIDTARIAALTTPYDLETNRISVARSKEAGGGFVYQSEFAYISEVRKQSFREINLVNLEHYIAFVKAKGQNVDTALMHLVGVSDSTV